MRNYFIVINCRLRKKTQNCPKTSVFDQKTVISWSIFPIKKRKTVPPPTVYHTFAMCSHMKIRESSTLKYITEIFSAKHL